MPGITHHLHQTLAPRANVLCVSTDNRSRAAVHLEMTLTIKGNLLQNKERTACLQACALCITIEEEHLMPAL